MGRRHFYRFLLRLIRTTESRRRVWSRDDQTFQLARIPAQVRDSSAEITKMFISIKSEPDGQHLIICHISPISSFQVHLSLSQSFIHPLSLLFARLAFCPPHRHEFLLFSRFDARRSKSNPKSGVFRRRRGMATQVSALRHRRGR